MAIFRAAAATAVGLLVVATMGIGVQRVSPSSPDGRESSRQRHGRAATDGPAEDRVRRSYGDLPITFVENRGQADARVRYVVQGPRHAFFVTPDSVVLSLLKTTGGSPSAAMVPASTRSGPEPQRGVAVALQFVGRNPAAVLEGDTPAPGEFNYFAGNDPGRWHTRLAGYSQIAYRQLWPGIDLTLRGGSGELKYEFRVQPHARPENIRLAYAGANSLSLDATGELLIDTPLGVLRDSAPIVYQEIGGVRVPVESRYILIGTGYGFALGASYDPAHALIIDPGLEYSTFLGGASNELATGIAVNAAGNAFVVGYTQSPNFPTSPGAFDRTGSASNNLDAFVTKLNAAGTAIVYSTFIGAGNSEWGRAIAVDSAGNAYVAGQTMSSAFPTTGGAFDRTFNIDNCPRCGIDQQDAFVLKLNAAGSSLVYSTFLGGTQFDDALAIAIDAAGNAYVAGETGSSNFPTTAGAFDRTPNGEFDAFVTKLNATGSALVYSTLVGGSLVDLPWDVAVGPSNTAYVVGDTRSPDFPTTGGAFDTTANGAFDGFVVRLNPAGSGLVYSTYLGGADFDSAPRVAVDAGGSAFVAGTTSSADFPTTTGAFDRVLEDSEAFVSKLNPTGTALAFSTFLGGSGGDAASAIALAADGRIWLGGGTSSTDFPVTADAFDPTFNGSVVDAFVATLDATGSQVLFASYLGGTNNGEFISDLALDAAGGVYVTGQTMSADFPTTPGAFDRTWSGDLNIFWVDAFVVKVSPAGIVPPDTGPPPPPALASLTLNPTSVAAGNVSTAFVTLTSAALPGGVPLTLSSSNPAVASVPSGTGIESGQTTVPVGVLTGSVTTATDVTISASYNAVTVSAVLRVTPPPPPSPPPSGTLPAPTLVSPQHDARFPPGQTVLFDWNDVTGAVSYTIQIDNSDSFTNPLTFTQTLAASQIPVAGLPTVRMWWRVRATNASGATGNWSQVRRFELK